MLLHFCMHICFRHTHERQNRTFDTTFATQVSQFVHTIDHSRANMAKKPLGILKKDAVRARPPQVKPKKQKQPQPAPPEKAAAAATEPKVRPKLGKSAPNGAAAAAAALLKGGSSDAGKPNAAGQQGQQQQEQKEWVPHSPVVRFAAEALAKLLAADASQRSGKTIKALTLAPHVTTKKATFALTCQTLRCGYLTS